MDFGNSTPKICIVGAGFSGLCAAIQLRKQLNLESFTIYDENHDVGGTWLVNTYPGCACDIPSHLYSFSFEPNPNWSQSYSPQPEIWDYLRSVTKKYDLYSKCKFNHRITKVEYQEKIGKWNVSILDIKRNREETQVFDILISGVGALRVPNYPPQFEAFKGTKVHSAVWDSSVELKDKVVAIVGSGASAVQIIPAIADKVKKLLVYQRRPAWVIPKLQFPFPEYVKWALAYVPGLQWSLRSFIFWSFEICHSAFKVDTFMGKAVGAYSNWHVKNQIKDPALREKLRPNYIFGCKRMALSNDYLPALAKPNVTVIRNHIKDVTKDAIVTDDGTVVKPDVLILATGFKFQDFFSPLKITAKDGEDLFLKWKKEGPSAYYGTVCNAAPNAFFLLGPNTALGHNTVVFTIECQTNWMIQVIREMMKRKAGTVTIRKSAEKEYMSHMRTAMKSTVWATDCGAWYASESGEVTALWPETLVSFYQQLRIADVSKFEFA